MDLINGKILYCPECNQRLVPNGNEHGKVAHVEAYCPICGTRYHWIAYISKDNEHKITGFHNMFHTKT